MTPLWSVFRPAVMDAKPAKPGVAGLVSGDFGDSMDADHSGHVAVLCSVVSMFFWSRKSSLLSHGDPILIVASTRNDQLGMRLKSDHEQVLLAAIGSFHETLCLSQDLPTFAKEVARYSSIFRSSSSKTLAKNFEKISARITISPNTTPF